MDMYWTSYMKHILQPEHLQEAPSDRNRFARKSKRQSGHPADEPESLPAMKS